MALRNRSSQRARIPARVQNAGGSLPRGIRQEFLRRPAIRILDFPRNAEWLFRDCGREESPTRRRLYRLPPSWATANGGHFTGNVFVGNSGDTRRALCL